MRLTKSKAFRIAYAVILFSYLWPCAATWAGSHSVQSGPITVDTREGSFKITDVSSRYCNGAYGKGGSDVHFLAGVTLFLDFTAQVEWGDKTPARLEFNGASQNWPNATKNLNVGALGAGGKLEVVAIASDGTRSAPFRANFQVVPLPPFANMLFYPQSSPFISSLRYTTPELDMEVFKGKSGVIEGVPIPGETMEIMPKFKAEAEFSGDGVLTVKSAVGQNRGIKLNDTGIRKPNGQFGKAAAVDFGLDVEGEVVALWSRELGTWVVNSGYMGLNFYGKYSSPPFYLYAPPPIYARFEIGADGQIGVRVTDLGDGSGWTPQVNAGGTFPDIKGIIGCGASGVLALEGYIGVAGKFEFKGPPVVCTKLGVEGKIGAQVVLLMFTLPLDIWSGAYWIVGGDGPQRAASPLKLVADGALPINLAEIDPAAFRLMDRDYLTRSQARPLGLAPAVRTIKSTGGTETTIVPDGYPYPEPALALAGATNHLLYVRDNPGRLPENRTEVVHALESGSGWSVGSTVWDDDTGDFAPQAAPLPNGSLLAVWGNMGSALTNGAGLDEALAGLEIAAGHFNAGTGLWTCRNLTTNDWLDHSPVLSVAPDGSAAVAWIRNRDNNPTGTTNEPNEILVSHWNGSEWSTETSVAADLGSLTYIDMAWDGDEGALVYALDMDDDLATLADQELFGCAYSGGSWGTAVRLTSDAVQDTRPFVRYDADGNFLVVWFRDGRVMSASGMALASSVEVGEIGIASGAQDFKLVDGPAGQMGVVWQDAGSEGVVAPDPYIINYDPEQELWSEGVRLLDDLALERGFSGAFGADGHLRLAYCKVAVGEDAEGTPTSGAVDLCVLDHPVGPDPAIGPHGIALSTNTVEIGESVDILVTVENCGEWAVTNLGVCVYAGNPAAGGTLIGSMQRVAQVQGGATSVVTVPWTVSQSASNLVLYAVVDPGLETADRNRDNNSALLAAILPDLALEGTTVQHETPTVRLLTANVVNAGSAPVAAGARVTFRRGALDGELLAEDSLGALVPGTNGAYDVGFRWDMGGTAFTSAFEIVYVEVDPDNAVEEIEPLNNVAAIQVMTSLDSDGDELLDGEELQRGTAALSADTDGDGLLDGHDMSVAAADPRYLALAAAGIAYADNGDVRTFRGELSLGTDSLKQDTDGDSLSDGDELRAGTDPLSTTDVFRVVDADGEVAYAYVVTWSTKAERTYRIETTGDLAADDWSSAPSGPGEDEQNPRTAIADWTLRYRDPTPAAELDRFYRVTVLP